MKHILAATGRGQGPGCRRAWVAAWGALAMVSALAAMGPASPGPGEAPALPGLGSAAPATLARPGVVPAAASPMWQLRLKLADGSLVIGQPSSEWLPIQTQYGNLRVPYADIRAATFARDHQRMVLHVANGDRFIAQAGITAFTMETLFGPVKVSTQHVSTLAVLPVGSAVASGWPSEGLWGYWPLDGDAKDASGNGRNGEVKGAKLGEGVRGQGYAFDGSATIELGQPDFSGGDFTVSGWVRTRHPAKDGEWRAWIGKLDTQGETGPLELLIGDGRADTGKNGPGFMVWNSGQGLVNITGPKVNLRDGRWHHCAATMKKGSQKLYVDGKLVAEAAYDGPLPASAAPVAIGSQQLGAYHHPWIGDVDEVFIYVRSLASEEVQALYNAGESADAAP